MGVSSIGSASKVTHLTTAGTAAAIGAEGVLHGANGVFASTRVYSTYTGNSVATLVPGLSGEVQVTGQAAARFRPVPVVGPTSAWTRVCAGTYYTPYTNINFAQEQQRQSGSGRSIPCWSMRGWGFS